MFYRVISTNRIINDNAISTVKEITGLTVEDLIKTKRISIIEKPNVIDFLKEGNRVMAIMLYREIFDCRLSEASSMVNKIIEDMRKDDIICY